MGIGTSKPSSTLINKLRNYYLLPRIKRERKQTLRFYLAGDCSTDANYWHRQPLESLDKQHGAIEIFLNSLDQFLSLILGDAGTGKSALTQRLIDYFCEKSTDTTYPGFVPIRIELKGYDQQSVKSCIQQALTEQFELSVEEINELKKMSDMVFLLDGYDEIAGHARMDLYRENKLDTKWPKAKVLITCRNQHFKDEEDCRRQFHLSSIKHPQHHQQRNISVPDLLYLAPFDENQIERYLEQFATISANLLKLLKESASNIAGSEPVVAVFDLAKSKSLLKEHPHLKEVLQIPFVLYIFAETLPSLLKRYDNDIGNIVMSDIYEQFLDDWFNHAQERLEASVGYANLKEKIEELKRFFCNYAQDFAFTLFAEKEIEITYKPLNRNDKSEICKQTGHQAFKHFFESIDGNQEEQKELNAKRAACPLRRSVNHVYSFIHKSFQDYLAAKYLFALLQDRYEGIKHLTGKNAFSIIMSNPNHPQYINLLEVLNAWNKRFLTEDRLVLQFLAELLNKLPFKERQALVEKVMRPMVQHSAQDKSYEKAASSIISVLCAARVTMSEWSLSGVSIPNADLSGAILHRANLTKANLTGVIFVKAYLAETDFSGSQMKDVQFGELHYLKYEKEIRCLSYSPDGLKLAVGQENNIVITEASTGKQLQVLKGHNYLINSVAWIPNSNTLASGSQDQTLRLWDVESSKSIKVLQVHTNQKTWSPDGKMLASGGNDKNILLWDVESGKVVKVLQGHEDRVISIIWSPNSNTLASGSQDQTVWLWDVDSGKALKVLQAHNNEVSIIVWSPDGKMLASGASNKNILLWDVESGKVVKVLQGHSDWVSSVAWSPDVKTLASADTDGSMRLWNVESCKVLQMLQGHEKKIISIVWSPDGKTLASGDAEGSVRLWNVGNTSATHMHQGHSRSVLSVSSSLDDRMLVSGSLDSSVRLWDVQSGRLIHMLERNREVIRVAFRHDCQLLVSGSHENSVLLWDAKTGKMAQLLKHDNYWGEIEFSNDGKKLASGSPYSDDFAMVQIWDLEFGKTLHVLKYNNYGVVSSLAWSRDGKMLGAGGGYAGVVELWDVKSGKILHVLQGHIQNAASMAFSPDGKTLVVGGSDGNIVIWDVESVEALKVLREHTHTVRSVAWSCDSKSLASGSDDSTIRIWDVVSYKCLTVIANGAPVLSISFNSQGQLISGDASPNNAVRLWECRHNQWYLKWSSPQQSLCMAGCIIRGVEGLSSNNRRLIEQRAAEIKFIRAQATSPSVISDDYQQDKKRLKEEIQTVAPHDTLANTQQNWTNSGTLNTVKVEIEKQTPADNEKSSQNITYYYNIGSINYPASLPGQPFINTLNAAVSIGIVNQRHTINPPVQPPSNKDFHEEKNELNRAKLISISDYLLLNLQELNHKFETDASYLQVRKLKELIDAGNNIIAAVNGKVIEEKCLLYGILCLATAYELLPSKKQAEKSRLALSLEKACVRLPLSHNHNLLHMCAAVGNRSLFNFWLNYREACNNLTANSEDLHSMLYATDEKGDTPLHIAARYGHARVVKIILDSMEKMGKLNESINKQNKEGQSALHLAVAQEQPQCHKAKQDYSDTIKCLLKAGSNQNLTDNQQKTPLAIAYKNNERDVIDLFLSHQTNVFTQEVTKNRQVSIPHLAPREKIIMQPPQPVLPKNYALPVIPVMPASRSTLYLSDLRPTDYVYAQLAFAAYDNLPKDLPNDWEVLPGSILNDTMHWGNQFNPFNGKSGYFGVIFVNYTKRQLVLAIRGTLGSNPGSLTADKEGVVDALLTPQQTKLYAQVRDAVIRAKDMGYHLSITGHSLGAWLAGVAIYYCHTMFNYNAVSAVVFECPGTLPMIEGPLAVHTVGNQPNLRDFDITIYLSLPNRIDACNPHIGTLFYMQPVESYKSYTKEPHDLAAHHMGGLLGLFKDAEQNLPKRIRMIDWPTMGDELKLFFKEGNIKNGFLPNIEKLKDNEQFRLIIEAHFIPDASWNADRFIYLKHFSRELQAFIRNYWQKFNPYLQSANQNLIREYLSSLGCSESLMTLLTGFSLDNSWQVLIFNQNAIYSVIDFREKLATELQRGGPDIVQRITDNSINLNTELNKLRAELDKLKIAPPPEPGPSLLRAKGPIDLTVGRFVTANVGVPAGSPLPQGLNDAPDWVKQIPATRGPLVASDSPAVSKVNVGEHSTYAVHSYSLQKTDVTQKEEEEKKTLQQTLERPESPGLR